MTPPLPSVWRLTERIGDDGETYRDYRNDKGQTTAIRASTPGGVIPEPDTATQAAQAFARSNLRQAS